MLSQRAPQEGFSIIELMIAIAILAISLALATPSYRAWIQNTRIRNTAESFQNGLQLARNEAVRLNAPVQFALVGTEWTVGCVTATASCPAMIQNRVTEEGGSSAITATASDGNTIVFNNLGRISSPVPASGTAWLRVDISTAVLSALDSRELCIAVSQGGATRMCDPNTTAPDPRACSPACP